MGETVEIRDPSRPNEVPPTHSRVDEESLKPKTLPRVAGRIPTAAWIIVFLEFCERFAYYGASNAFVNYLEHPPQTKTQLNAVNQGHGTLQPGALGKGRATAVSLNQFFHFFAYFTPIIGGFLSDQYWGKFRTIWIFSIVSTVGWCLLTVSAYPYDHEKDGTPRYSNLAFIGFIVSIVVIGFGIGGIKPNVGPLVADQVSEEVKTVTDAKGETRRVDYQLTIQRVYQYFYWAINSGALIGQVSCTFIERTHEGFWKAYLLPGVLFVTAITVFVSAKNKYRLREPKESPMKQAWMCLKYARRRQRKYEGDGLEKQSGKSTMLWWILFPFTILCRFFKLILWDVPKRFVLRQRSRRNALHAEEAARKPFSFLDYAKPFPNEPLDEKKERKWNSKYPDDLREMLKACAIFAPLCVYFLTFVQMANSLISQAGQMTRPKWLNNDLLNVLNPIVVILMIPFFDRVIYPTLQKRGIGFSHIKRISVGFFFGALAMGWSAMVQHMIYHSAPYYNHPLVDDAGNTDTGTPNEISVWWQVPAYVLIAISEIFAAISAMEYAYLSAPKELTSIISAFSYLPNAVAGLLGIALSPLVIDPHMTLFYLILAIASFLTGIWFYIAFAHFDDEQDLRNAVECVVDVAPASQETVKLDNRT